jgi:hypothetical protein
MQAGVVSPVGTTVHVPTRPGSVHDEHLSVQAVVQQRPSTQLFVVQSVLTLHILPAGHLGQFMPPQPTSVSSPSIFPSVQLAHIAL